MPTPTTYAAHLARTVERAVRAAGGAYNMAPLALVRDRLAAAGITNRREQNDAIWAARLQGLVTATSLEKDITQAQRNAGLPDDGGRLIGYLSVRE